MQKVRAKALVWIVRPGRAGVEVLTLRRPAHRGGGWHPVTGKADRDETPERAAVREAHEETGLRGVLEDLGWAHAFETPRGPMVEHSFLLRVSAGAEPKLSDEHVAARWQTIAEARAVLEWESHRHTLELVAAALGKSPGS